jgi:hypothetical protein
MLKYKNICAKVWWISIVDISLIYKPKQKTMKEFSIKEQLTGKTIYLVKDWSRNILSAFIYYGEAMEFLNKCEDEEDEESKHKYLFEIEEIILK